MTLHRTGADAEALLAGAALIAAAAGSLGLRVGVQRAALRVRLVGLVRVVPNAPVVLHRAHGIAQARSKLCHTLEVAPGCLVTFSSQHQHILSEEGNTGICLEGHVKVCRQNNTRADWAHDTSTPAHLRARLHGGRNSGPQVGHKALPQHARHMTKQAVRVLAQLAVAQRQALHKAQRV